MPETQKPHLYGVGFLFSCDAMQRMRSLTITYFHTGIRTIIGVESFHGPVRDGKGWYQLAMVIRHKGGVVVGLQVSQRAITTNLGKK